MNATPQPISSRRKRLFCGAPDTFLARSRPDSEVMSVKVTGFARATGPAGGSARRVCARADAGAASALCARLERNSRRENGAGRRLIMPGSIRTRGHRLHIPVRLAAFLLELVRLALQPGERFHRRAALLHLSDPPVDRREHIVIRRSARVDRNGAIQRIRSRGEAGQSFESLAHLKPCTIGFGINLRGFPSMLEGFLRVLSPVIVSAQIDMTSNERTASGFVEPDRSLVICDCSRIIAQGPESKAERVVRLDVRRVEPDRFLQLPLRGRVIVLN